MKKKWLKWTSHFFSLSLWVCLPAKKFSDSSVSVPLSKKHWVSLEAYSQSSRNRSGDQFISEFIMGVCSRHHQCLTYILFILPYHCALVGFQLPISPSLNLKEFFPNHRRTLCPGTHRKAWELTLPQRHFPRLNNPTPLSCRKDNDETCVWHPFADSPCVIKTVSHHNSWFINTLLFPSPSLYPFPVHLLLTLPNKVTRSFILHGNSNQDRAKEGGRASV